MLCPGCRTTPPLGAESCPLCGTKLSPNPREGEFPPPPPQTYEGQTDGYAEPGYHEPVWDAEMTDPIMDDRDPGDQQAWSRGDHGPPPIASEPTAHLPQTDGSTRVLSSDPERDKHTRIVQAPPPPKIPPRRARQVEIDDPILSKEFEAALTGLNNVYKRLKSPEKLALWATVAAFLASFSPWYYVKGTGLISGIESQGWIIALLTSASLIVLYFRFSLRWGIFPSLFQLLLIAGAAFASVYYTLVPVHESIRFGLPAAALTASLASVFTIAGMLSRT